jgi:hypothetical protein
MLANCRDIWERDYAHLAPHKKVKKTSLKSGYAAGKRRTLPVRRLIVLKPGRLRVLSFEDDDWTN